LPEFGFFRESLRIDILRRLSSLPLQAIALFILASGTLVFAGTITGTVTNKTTGKPAAGDNVSLLSLA